MSDLIERLRETKKTLDNRCGPNFHRTGETYSVYRVETVNPDGHEAANEIERLRAENEKLRAALKPFAELAEYYDVEPDDQPAWDNDFQPTIGDLRAAAAAIRESGDE